MNNIVTFDKNDIVIQGEMKEREEKIKYLSESETKRVIENARFCYKVVFSLLYELGARINEVVSLKYSDIQKILQRNCNFTRTLQFIIRTTVKTWFKYK